MSYKPTREDHFNADNLKKWLEDHNLPVSKDPEKNRKTMVLATGGRV